MNWNATLLLQLAISAVFSLYNYGTVSPVIDATLEFTFVLSSESGTSFIKYYYLHTGIKQSVSQYY